MPAKGLLFSRRDHEPKRAKIPHGHSMADLVMVVEIQEEGVFSTVHAHGKSTMLKREFSCAGFKKS